MMSPEIGSAEGTIRYATLAFMIPLLAGCDYSVEAMQKSPHCVHERLSVPHDVSPRAILAAIRDDKKYRCWLAKEADYDLVVLGRQASQVYGVIRIESVAGETKITAYAATRAMRAYLSRRIRSVAGPETRIEYKWSPTIDTE